MQIFDNLHAFLWQSMTTNNCNTFFIDGPARILIDPGHSHLFDHVQDGLLEQGRGLEDVDLIICTHAHPDHMEAVQLFQGMPARITMHQREWQSLKDMERYISASFSVSLDKLAPEFFLNEGEFSIQGMDFRVYYTPGHTQGSLSLYWPDYKVLFSGDLIFKGGIGRTDLPGGDGSLLKASILQLAELDIEWVMTGHGDIIQGADEVKENFEHLQQFWFAYL